MRRRRFHGSVELPEEKSSSKITLQKIIIRISNEGIMGIVLLRLQKGKNASQFIKVSRTLNFIFGPKVQFDSPETNTGSGSWNVYEISSNLLSSFFRI